MRWFNAIRSKFRAACAPSYAQQIISDRARGDRDRCHRWPGGRCDGQTWVAIMHTIFSASIPASGCRAVHARSALRGPGAVPGRPAVRSGVGLHRPPARHRVTGDRAQCAAWRRMSMRGRLIVASLTVWSSGIGASVRLEGRLHPARQRAGLQDRRRFPAETKRHARAGRLRRRGRHRRCFWRAARRRFLRLRIVHRQLCRRLRSRRSAWRPCSATSSRVPSRRASSAPPERGVAGCSA